MDYIKESGGEPLTLQVPAAGSSGLFRLDSLLFPSLKDESPYDNKQIERDFVVMQKKIGIDDEKRRERNIVFHSWRHYCAKNLAHVTNRTVGMAILGLKTSAVFDHYANHIDGETFGKMAEAIEQGLKPGKTEREPIPFRAMANK
jgi:integrase